jgi:hypothetical protein
VGLINEKKPWVENLVQLSLESLFEYGLVFAEKIEKVCCTAVHIKLFDGKNQRTKIL